MDLKVEDVWAGENGKEIFKTIPATTDDEESVIRRRRTK